MIKIEKTEVYGWEAAIRGMRNPLESWDRSDSGMKIINMKEVQMGWEPEVEYRVGENDLALMKKLSNAGSDHRKFMRFINVTCDITAPMYIWKELDTYKVGTVRNSCSTMHCIHKKEFTLDDFSCEHLSRISEYLGKSSIDILRETIVYLNWMRKRYLESKDKKYWWQMIQLLPSSYNQKSTMQFNYEVLANIYHSRKNHKLDEWKEFCSWIESLPYSEIIIGDRGED